MAGTGGNMMGGVLTAGRGESGFGAVISGFHCPAREFPSRLDDVRSQIPFVHRIAQTEDEGIISFLAARNEYEVIPHTTPRLAVYRREPHKFFSDLSSFLKSIRAQIVEQMTLSGSLGSIQLTLLYYPAPGMDEPGA